MKRIWFALATAGLILLGASRMAAADGNSSGADERADERQARQIWSTLREASDLQDNLIQVDVEDGIATLEGAVDSGQERTEAQQLAHVGGILGVNNRLKVRRCDD